jgi:hypothetical protein
MPLAEVGGLPPPPPPGVAGACGVCLTPLLQHVLHALIELAGQHLLCLLREPVLSHHVCLTPAFMFGLVADPYCKEADRACRGRGHWRHLNA